MGLGTWDPGEHTPVNSQTGQLSRTLTDPNAQHRKLCRLCTNSRSLPLISRMEMVLVTIIICLFKPMLSFRVISFFFFLGK